MALRLESDNGKVRRYETVYVHGGGDSPEPETHETMCGMKWIRPKQPIEGCEHLDCAIDVTDHQINELKLAVMLTVFSFGILYTITTDLYFSRILLTILIILIIIFARDGYGMIRRHKELIEFKEYGTINGTKEYKLK